MTIKMDRLLSRAKSHVKKGEAEKARMLFNEILAVYPQNQQAKRGIKALQKDSITKNNKTGISQTQIDHVSNLYRKGQVQETLVAIETLTKRYPNEPLLYNIQGGCFSDLGQLDVAIKCFERALAIKPGYVDVLNNLGVALHDLGRFDEAVRSYMRAVRVQPNYAKGYFNIGQAFNALSQFDEAVKFYKKAIAIKPDYADAYSTLGTIFHHLGQLDSAIKSYERAIEINPHNVDVLNNLANRYSENGQLNLAVKIYMRTLAINPDYAEAYSNLGAVFHELDQLDEAVENYERALAISPNFVVAHSNLGRVYHELGQSDAAIKSFEKALIIKPDYAEGNNNLGVVLHFLGQLDASVKCYKKALTINPNYVEAQYNLGNAFRDLHQLNAAVMSYEKALAMQSDFQEAYRNLGGVLGELGQLDAAFECHVKDLLIKDSIEVWNNLFFSAKSLTFLEVSKGVWLKAFENRLSTDVLKSSGFAILNFRLNAFKPHKVEDSFNAVIEALPLKTDEEIANPLPTQENQLPVLLSKNLIALFHFGRSGTGLLHSLIDNHPEISTLPSIYFSEYYNEEVWGRLIAQGWDQLPENFIRYFAVLFDARSSMSVPGIEGEISNLGQKEGMTNVGESRDEILVVNKETFCLELKQLMVGYSKIGPRLFFDLVHVAYEKALKNNASKHTLFYHIHNPGPYAKLNFLRYNPESRLVMMVREPMQSCESWVKSLFNSKDMDKVQTRIITMLYDIDQTAFRRQDCIGVRLEDLKAHPKETIVALCNWMGVNEEESLYEMTAQGKKWWGDPSSPDYGKEGMSPFDKAAIKRPIGSIFSDQDQFILRTLFYPFRVRFGYAQEDHEEFKTDLQTIKPLLDEAFDFEKKLAELSGMPLETFLRSALSVYFRASLHDRWSVLAEFNDYPHMLKPLTISVKT
jgi:tetratricopeptide (TPR) repeat protein